MPINPRRPARRPPGRETGSLPPASILKGRLRHRLFRRKPRRSNGRACRPAPCTHAVSERTALFAAGGMTFMASWMLRPELSGRLPPASPIPAGSRRVGRSSAGGVICTVRRRLRRGVSCRSRLVGGIRAGSGPAGVLPAGGATGQGRHHPRTGHSWRCLQAGPTPARSGRADR